ncbi:L,D-transpeptidase [Dactylosporangium aurantiacum]|uniref:L,D-transpeptidase n=1 Tax=Dactylosporangium aurantiacum TaxID=35754 RepID=A0A9Q9IB07_9ACTN|nr:L,D-transpeptidase [Dactylosporangium aurantiacum]MDG6102595.1 L,D-transpeptidase [Dactylosporangium aurantiacum]UWZ53144.1 L,D-transpeptidase [Dactylosporangium aurantiacum]
MLVRRAAALTALALCLTGGSAACGGPPKPRAQPAPAATPAAPAPSSASPAPPAAATTPPAAPAAAGLPTITYTRAAAGFPADPDQSSTVPLTEALHPTAKLAAYDAPGGTARAYLTPDISGVRLVMPIVARRAGWVAVLLPTLNRSVGWLPAGGWSTVPLRDQLVVRRGAYTLTWLRDGVAQHTWTVTVGAAATPTPLGRTFVLGRSSLPSKVYAGLDVLALGAVPDDKGAVAEGLQDAHTGIHAWYRDEFGYRRSNGCVRMPPAAQKILLDAIPSGTSVVVLP